jgi:hypothetical protein
MSLLNVSTQTNDTIPNISPVNYAAISNVIVLLVGTFSLHVMTAHVATPESSRTVAARVVSMTLSPITAGIASFNTIFVSLLRVLRDECPTPIQRALAAGSLAIHIPHRLEVEHTLERVPRGVPFNASEELDNPAETIYYVPWTARLVDNHYGHVAPGSPIRNNLATVLALIQLFYTVFKAYIDYSPAIEDMGLSSPYILVLPYLWASFLNLVANLLQGSYSHVTVLESEQEFGTINGLDREVTSSPNSGGQEELREYLAVTYPGIVFERSILLTVTTTTTIHHGFSLALIVTLIGLFTGYEEKLSMGALFLVAICLDIVVQPILEALQVHENKRATRVLWRSMGIFGVRMVCCVIYICAWISAAKAFYNLYLI